MNNRMKTQQNNHTQFFQIEHSLSAFLSDDFVRNALLTNLKINAGIAFFGILANLFNIFVFVKQGFRDTINISLTSLAVSDLSSLFFLLWMWLCYEPSFIQRVRYSFNPIELTSLTGGIPRGYFTLVGSWITCLISTERCISVIRPFHVKLLFTKGRLVFINVFIFITVSGPTIPLYFSSRLTKKTDPRSNRTYVGVTFTENRRKIDFFHSFFAVVMSVCTFVIVFVSATIIILTLARRNKWRAQITNQAHANTSPVVADSVKEKTEEVLSSTPKKNGDKVPENSKGNKKSKKKKEASSRDNRATKTVTLIAIMFIICYLPGTLNKLVMAFVSDYSTAGRYSNMFRFFWSVSFITEAICSSANVFVYVATNTKFKETLIVNIFRCLR